jgi:hypothetical protein
MSAAAFASHERSTASEHGGASLPRERLTRCVADRVGDTTAGASEQVVGTGPSVDRGGTDADSPMLAAVTALASRNACKFCADLWVLTDVSGVMSRSLQGCCGRRDWSVRLAVYLAMSVKLIAVREQAAFEGDREHVEGGLPPGDPPCPAARICPDSHGPTGRRVARRCQRLPGRVRGSSSPRTTANATSVSLRLLLRA